MDKKEQKQKETKTKQNKKNKTKQKKQINRCKRNPTFYWLCKFINKY